MRDDEPPDPCRNRLNPNEPGRTVASGNSTTVYRELVTPSGVPEVAVRLSQTVSLPGEPEQSQRMWADLKPLKEICEWARTLAARLSYRPHLDATNPEHEREFENHRAMLIGRETKGGEKHVAVILSRTDIAAGERQPEQMFITTLKALENVVKDGLEYHRDLGRAERFYLVIQLKGLGREDGTAQAKVIGWHRSMREAETHAAKVRAEQENWMPRTKAREFRIDAPIAWPEPWRTKPGEIDVRVGLSKEVNVRIDLMRWNQEREGPNFVVARWDDPDSKPKVGDKVKWGGKEARSTGEPLDYKAGPGDKPLNDRTRTDGDFILIDKASKEVVDVSKERDDIVQRFRAKEFNRQVLGPEWNQMSFSPGRR